MRPDRSLPTICKAKELISRNLSAGVRGSGVATDSERMAGNGRGVATRSQKLFGAEADARTRIASGERVG